MKDLIKSARVVYLKPAPNLIVCVIVVYRHSMVGVGRALCSAESLEAVGKHVAYLRAEEQLRNLIKKENK